MKIYLIRHGEAEPPQVNPERPLTTNGVAEVRALAERLRPLSIRCEVIHHSPKARARQTAELLAPVLGGADRLRQHDGIFPMDPVAPVAEELSDGAVDVALVGHLPFVSNLVAHLVRGTPAAQTVGFLTATAACVERGADRTWQLVWLKYARE